MTTLTSEQAFKIHYLIWNKIMDNINKEKETFINKEYNVKLIIQLFVGRKNWLFNDPLCELYQQKKKLPTF
jgi:hypothetical protein